MLQLKMKKKILVSYRILFIVGLILILCSYRFATVETVYNGSGEQETEISPMRETRVSDDVREFYIELDETNNINRCLRFLSNHQYIRVFADGQMIYSVQKGNDRYGATTGTIWNMVEIPDHAREIIVEITACYPAKQNQTVTFYIGSAVEMYHSLIWRSIPETIVSFLNLLTGMILIIYWWITRKKSVAGKEILYFGIFAALMGCWCLNETEMATLLIQNRIAASFAGYIILMLMAIPFILFVRIFLRVKDKNIWKILCLLSCLNFIITCTLELTRIADFRDTVLVTHLMLALALLYQLGAIGQRVVRKDVDSVVKTNVAGILILIFAIIMDLIAFYAGSTQTDAIGRFGLLAYILILAREATKALFIRIDQGRKTEIYKELAFYDILTKQKNRMAFQKDIQDIPTEGTMVVMLDLNSLKYCNDHMGHAAGDRYIMIAGEMIRATFSEVGDSYRIGGDEFCVLIPNGEACNIHQRLEQLETLQENYNQSSKDIRVKIAIGYAIFDRSMDKDLEDTRTRADKNMYKKKVEMKKVNV